MGNCVPILRDSEPKHSNHIVDAEYVPMETLIPENYVDTQCQVSENCFDPRRTVFREPSNMEETFFDSHPSLDSDCDDFFSVNGDTTPSIYDTPSSRRDEETEITRPLDGPINIDDATTMSKHEPTSKSKANKLLIDLFQESFNDDERKGQEGNETSHLSIVQRNIENRKPRQAVICCLPNLVRNFSSSGDKKKDTQIQCCLEQCPR